MQNGVLSLYKEEISPDYPVTVKSLSGFVITLFVAAIDAHDNPSVFTPRKFRRKLLNELCRHDEVTRFVGNFIANIRRAKAAGSFQWQLQWLT
ncbi:unnamed protein product [Lasius platythorax]|uniref:Uncharacterized protein n=1 Tax=Lasius platythorax TaxID=488582 RepID=A0AAV2N8R9_9HYME